MSIVVARGAGFISSYGVGAVLASGIAVTAFDDLSLGQRENPITAALTPMVRFGRSEMALLVPSATCRLVQKGIDESGIQPHEESI